jgi:hypothetical protein
VKILEANGFMPDVIEAIEKLQAKIYRYSGRRGITRISVDSDFGLNHGLVPGTTAILWTSCGPVELFCERRLDLEYDTCRCGAARKETTEKTKGFFPRTGCLTCNRWDNRPILDGTPTV